MTNSGKTFLAQRFMKSFQEREIKTLVLQPFLFKRWGADYETDNMQEFLHVYFKSLNCVAFIDEASQYCGRGVTHDMIKTATIGRHLGHVNYYIAQRGSQINMTIREQCNELFLFRQGVKDSTLWAEEFANEKLKQASELRHHEFFYANKDGRDVKKYITDLEKTIKLC